MEEGFFTKKETTNNLRPDGKVYSCISCGLYKNCKSPKLEASGNFNKGILNICVSPSTVDDRKGKVYQGKEFLYLKSLYERVKVDLEDDCLNTYAIKCFTEDSITNYHIDNCRKFIIALIEKHKPRVIVLFGDEALYSVIGHRWKRDLGTINKWQGWQIPDQDFNTWICPTFNPENVMNSTNPVEEIMLLKDLKEVLRCSDTPLRTYPEPEIVYLKNDLSILDSIDHCTVAFDYETTGIKPHAEGHRIVAASVAVNENKVYSFMMPETRTLRRPFTNLLQRESVAKIAHNMKFEDTWSKVRLKTDVKNWVWDTMIATHVFDNRSNICSLKFQAYVQLGIIDYDSEISEYLKSKESNNANAINRINELLEKPTGVKKLLKYCALDSLYEYRIEMIHMDFIQSKIKDKEDVEGLSTAYTLLHDGILALGKAERQGLRIDTEYAENQKKRLTKKIQLLEEKIFASNFYKHWQHSFSGKVNLNSGDQLGTYLYNIKKIKPVKFTEKGKGSTDEEALKMLNIDECNWILERSKLLKIRDTYLDAFLREQVDGYLHPFYNLHIARTYRSSSSNPNFQNIPKRDKEAMNIVRKAIFPRPGHQLLELDYSAIEVSIATTYHKDPTMIKYLVNKFDMHGDMAKQIFRIDKFDKHRKDHGYLRSCIKNSFVFPEFYGDYYKNCAANICSPWMSLPQGNWKIGDGYKMDDGNTIGFHLISKGIKSYTDFENHIQVIEKDFWTNRFGVYAKWKKRHYERYLKTGKVKLHTGFICSGVMGKNDVINYPVQGAAFHCLLWTLNKVTEALKQNHMESRIVGQIHDAILLDVHPMELIEVYNLVRDIGIRGLKNEFQWINVPMDMEAELCPIDGSWAEKKEWKPADE
jgi:uracil-DNA glycosylase family 4